TIADWLRTATPHIPVSWPALGIAPPTVHGAWMGKASKVSDFASHYWDSLQPGRTYSWGSGITERVSWMRRAFYRRQECVLPHRPQLMLDSISSDYYRKKTLGTSFYTPPQDILLAP